MFRAFVTLLRARRCQMLLKIALILGFAILVYLHLRSLRVHNLKSTPPPYHYIRNGNVDATSNLNRQKSQKDVPHQGIFKDHTTQVSTSSTASYTTPGGESTKAIGDDKRQGDAIAKLTSHTGNDVMGKSDVHLVRGVEGHRSPPLPEKRENKDHESDKGGQLSEVNVDTTPAESSRKTIGASRVTYIEDVLNDAYVEAESTGLKVSEGNNHNKKRFVNPKALNESSDKLVTVILMPHSHNDPGWLWTFDMYHQMRTEAILGNLVTFLSSVDAKMPFHWSESVSLLRWYKAAPAQSRRVIQSAIKANTLLIDHGSWSMPDEASTSLYSLVENLILGHTWINNEFNVTPEYSWANDPFGHSSTIPYLLKQCGIKAIVINRIDMLLKKRLRENQMLEFLWRKPGGGSESADDSLFTHVLPHALYSTQESFGPDFTFAKTFDFSPPEVRYSPIVDSTSGQLVVDSDTLKRRAKELAQQIHHRASYFKHNVVLSPIGDDFRYISYSEFGGVYRNWNHLRDYYKSNPKYNVRLKFGTLADYFSLVEHYSKDIEYPTLSGDFFPYSDDSDIKSHAAPPTDQQNSATYWTGYFTTRPFLKVGIRHLETVLRQTEILYSMYKLQVGAGGRPSQDLPTIHLSQARETLTWLLHHDAITGTSPTATIIDFWKHLRKATENLEQFSVKVMTRFSSSQSVNSTIPSQPVDGKEPDATPNVLVDTSPHVLVLPTGGGTRHSQRKSVLVQKDRETQFTVFNSLAHQVRTVVHVKLQVDEPVKSVQLLDSKGTAIDCQLNPFFDIQKTVHLNTNYIELVFEATIPALGMQAYTASTKAQQGKTCTRATIGMSTNQLSLFAAEGDIITKGLNGFPVTQRADSEDVKLDTGLNEIVVSSVNGTLVSMRSGRNGVPFRINHTFGLYNSRASRSNLENGIYIFSTKDEGTHLHSGNSTRSVMYTITGHVEVTVLSVMSHTVQCMRINKVQPGVSVSQQVSLGSDVGDLFTRVGSNVKSGARFYTDSNSFTMLERRRHYPSRPIAANYYPMTSSLYIEDKKHRLTLLSAQPLGVTSLHEGELEIMLERQHQNHDHAGVSDILQDKDTTLLQFRLLTEQLPINGGDDSPSLTPVALHQSLVLSFPVSAYTGVASSPVNALPSLPCDYHMLMLRSLDTLPQGIPKRSDANSLALVLQRFSIVKTMDGLDAQTCSNSNKVTLSLPAPYKVIKTSLSLLHTQATLSSSTLPPLSPNSLQTYRISADTQN